jgi:hypothetical protein
VAQVTEVAIDGDAAEAQTTRCQAFGCGSTQRPRFVLGFDFSRAAIGVLLRFWTEDAGHGFPHVV